MYIHLKPSPATTVQSSKRGKHSKIVIKPSPRALKAQQMDGGWNKWRSMQHKKLPSAAAAAAHHRRHQCIMKSSRKAEKQKSSNASILHFNAASWWHKFSHPVYLGICSFAQNSQIEMKMEMRLCICTPQWGIYISDVLMLPVYAWCVREMQQYAFTWLINILFDLKL